jgi:hypothetical protein
MRKTIVGAVSLAIVIVVMQTWAQAPPGKYSDPSRFHLAKPEVPIAGIPQDEALKIYERQAEKLRQLPGAVSVSFMAEGLMVGTANPAALPAAVEGLPVFAVPPVDPRAAGGLDYALSNPPPPYAPPPPESPTVNEPLPPPECPPGTYLKPGEGRCRRLNPPPIANIEPKLLPPPPGVTVLKPGKVRERADTCPEGFEEVEGYGGWRFCVNPRNPEKIPPLWSPPVAGIPYEEVIEIHKRHVEDLANLLGVESVGLQDDGIHVFTKNPEVVPKSAEGVPIIVHPATGRKIKLLNHTYNIPVRPLHGAILIGGAGYGTLTGVTLSDGHPWLIFPAHIAGTCNIVPPYSASGSVPLKWSKFRLISLSYGFFSLISWFFNVRRASNS